MLAVIIQWSRLRVSFGISMRGRAAPAIRPVALSDYPPFQLLPPEVQQYLLLQFEDFMPAGEWIIPDKTTMDQNYPNPFNPETWIPYQLSESADVTVSIYSMNGVLVRTLALGHQAAGIYQSKSRAAYWDGRNELGESVASGVYFYTLAADEFYCYKKDAHFEIVSNDHRIAGMLMFY